MLARIILLRGSAAPRVIDALPNVLGYGPSGVASHQEIVACYRPHRLLAYPGRQAFIWDALDPLDRSPSWDGWQIVVGARRPVMWPRDLSRSRVEIIPVESLGPDATSVGQARALVLALGLRLGPTQPPAHE